MTRLLLLRHAKAAPHSPDGDFARPLNPRGQADAARLGAFLASRGIVPAATLVSPAQRTRETAALVLAALPGAPAPLFSDALYNASVETLRAEIRAAPAGAETLLVIGHNPAIGELAHALAGDGADKLPAGFPTCALAIFEAAPGAAKGRWSHRQRLVECVTPASSRR